MTHSRTWEESQKRFEGFAEFVDAEVAVQQVVRIIGLESPPHFAARTNVALGWRTPCTQEQILVAPELGCMPDGIDAYQCVVEHRRGVSIGNNGSDPEVPIEVIRHPSGKQIRTRNSGRRQRKIGYNSRRYESLASLHIE